MHNEESVFFNMLTRKQQVARELSKFKFAGVYSGGAIPVPIPNTEVKSSSGDDNAVVTLCESSSVPVLWPVL